MTVVRAKAVAVKKQAGKQVQQLAMLQPDTNSIWKPVFWSVVVIASVLMLYSGWGTGFHSDEMDQNAYGKAVIRYYNSGGKDTSYLALKLPDGVEVAKAIKTYGVLFDVFLNNVTAIAGVKYEYDIRHFCIQLTGLCTMLLASLIVLRLTRGYKSALITFLLIYFTPTFFGHALFNSRDIPFAFGYTLGIYAMIIFFQNFHALRYRHSLFLGLAIGLSMSVRIGGLILYVVLAFMLLWFLVTDKTWRKRLFTDKLLLKYIGHAAIILILPYIIAVLSHPYIIASPVDHFLLCINTAKKFPNRIPLTFKGEFIDSLSIPKDYLATWMGITVPLAIIVFFFCGVMFLLFYYKKLHNATYLLLILFATVFPVLYAVKNSFALYTGWRHLLFVYPAAVIIAGYWSEYLRSRLWVSYTVPVIVCLSLLHPAYWMYRNHPFEYIYFNEISGGFAKNYYRYETDGWQVSVKKALEWVCEQEAFKTNKHNIIGTNCYSPVNALLKDKYNDKVTTVKYCGYKTKNQSDWNYLILNVNFLPPDYLLNYYPPGKTVKTIEVDGKPVCAVIYDPVRNDYHGIKALEENKLSLADSLLSLSMKEDPGSQSLLEAYTQCQAMKGNWPGTYALCQKGLGQFPESARLNYYLGLCFVTQKQYDKAISNIVHALELGFPQTAGVLEELGQLYAWKGDMTQADKLYKMARAQGASQP